MPITSPINNFYGNSTENPSGTGISRKHNSNLISAFHQTIESNSPKKNSKIQVDSQTIINNWPNKNMPSKISSRNKVTECTTQQQQQQKKILQGGLLWHKIDYPCKWTSLFSPFYNLVSLLFLHRPIQCQKITKKAIWLHMK